MAVDSLLLQLKTPSKAALFDDLKALLEAAGMAGFLPARSGDMIAPWRPAARTGHSGYRLDWVFFEVVRSDGESQFDRGLHCDVLVSRTDPAKPPVRQVLGTIRDRVLELAEVDLDSPAELLSRWGVTRARVRQAHRGSLILAEVGVPYHRFLGTSDGRSPV